MGLVHGFPCNSRHCWRFNFKTVNLLYESMFGVESTSKINCKFHTISTYSWIRMEFHVFLRVSLSRFSQLIVVSLGVEFEKFMLWNTSHITA